MHTHQAKAWTEKITPRRSIFSLGLKELWSYRDLLIMFVRRDFIATYKQTLLGPLWFFIQPVLTTVMFTIVFSRFARIPTGGAPPIVFYLSGITIWNYFSDCFIKTANVFTANAGIFGKVYFPRLVMPLSIIISGIVRFLVQFLMFLIVWLWYYYTTDMLQPNWLLIVALVPVLLVMMAGFAFGSGLIISALTTKYRDLAMLIQFGVQLLMYATPVIYPLSFLDGKSRALVMLNPLSSIVEGFRLAFLGSGHFSVSALLYSLAIMLVLVFSGILVFNRVERNFMDTV